VERVNGSVATESSSPIVCFLNCSVQCLVWWPIIMQSTFSQTYYEAQAA
jgi:hypothetical protein